ADRMLDRKQRRDLVVLEDDVAGRVDNESDVEEAILYVRVTGLGLGYYESVVLARQLAERIGLLTWDVDRAAPGELDVVKVQHLVVERLQATFRDRDQADREVEARQPSSRLYQMRQMLEVDLDVLPLPDASNCWYEADCGVRADNPATSLQLEIGRQLVAFQTPRPRPARRHEW